MLPAARSPSATAWLSLKILSIRIHARPGVFSRHFATAPLSACVAVRNGG
jgi:hypothetical protein